jgi:hypothetical protein
VKALSGRQPWWWAILHAGKRIENRRWNTHYRGPILLHAAKGCGLVECADAMAWMFDAKLIDGNRSWPGLDGVPRGGIVGRARIVDVIHPLRPLEKRPSEYWNARYRVDARWHMPEQFGFVLADVEELPFVAWPGALGVFNVPNDYARSS